MKNAPRHRAGTPSTGRRTTVLGAALALVFSLMLTGGQPAVAAGEAYATSVAIAPISPSPQKSGTSFTYEIEYTCSALDAGGQCENYQISIPLDDGDLLDTYSEAELLAMFAVDTATAEALQIVDGKLLIIKLGAVDGTAQSTTFKLTFTPPNYTTPNGTQWSFLPSSSADDAVAATASSAADGKATAVVNHTISKAVEGSSFKNPDDTFSYNLVVSCSKPSTGARFAKSMRVTDTLLPGLEFVSATPAGTLSGSTISWDFSGAAVPANCTSATDTGTVTLKINARVKAAPEAAAVEPGNAINNTASVTSVDADDNPVAAKSDSASITIYDPAGPVPAPGTLGFQKDSFGQLRDYCDPTSPTDCDPGTSAENQSHTTYAGNWLGVLTDQPANVLNTYKPNEKSGMRQAGYKMHFTSGLSGGAGWEVALRDPLPCLDNHSGSPDKTYSSNPIWSSGDAVPGVLCQNPAFHPTTVSVWTDSAGGTPNIDNAYRPTVIYSDGSSEAMTAKAKSSHYANFAVPNSTKTVAQIDFPRTAGISGPNTNWGVFGYVDSSVEPDSIVTNAAEARAWWKADAAEAGARKTAQDSADLLIISNPQIGIEKSFSKVNDPAKGQTKLTLASRLLTKSVTKDFAVTDLLPADMKVATPLPTITATVHHLAADGVTTTSSDVTGSVEVLNNFKGSGRQLIRILVPQDSMDDWGAARVEMTNTFIINYVDEPTTYANTAQVFYPDSQLSKLCQQVPSNQQEPQDPLDLNGNDDLGESSCVSSAQLKILPVSGPGKYQVFKTVQGDRDPAPRPFPAVGVVSEDNGFAVFGLGWKNTGGADLKGAIVYDIFPHVSDTGVGGDFADKPRNSQFTPTYESLVNPDPAHLTIAFTQQANPCRPEVYEDNPDCVDDWTTTEPADKATITGVRIVSDLTYTPGQSFVVDVKMTAPKLGNDPDDVASANSIAWNSVAGRATNLNGTHRLPISPPKVGITASSDPVPLLLSKELDPAIDPATVKVGDTVSYRLSITNPNAVDRELSAVDQLPAGLQYVTTTADAPATMAAVSYDASANAVNWTDQSVTAGATFSWTVKAKVLPGVSGNLLNRFSSPGGTSTTNPCEDDPDQECASVNVDPAELTVSKVVDGAGASFADGPYAINVLCTVGSTTVVNEDFSLATNGSTKTLKVPYGSSCAATETANGGATTAVVSPATAVAIVNGTATYNVTITNTFKTGQLVIKKLLTGQGTDFAGSSFTFGVTCVFDGRTVHDASVTVNRPAGNNALTSAAVTPLPIGAVCTVTETATGGADPTATVPTATVTIVENTAGNSVDATVTNEFSAGTVWLGKTLEGSGASEGFATNAVFTVDVVCALGDEDSVLYAKAVTIKGGEHLNLLDGNEEPVMLPLGARCWANESDAGGATAHTTNAKSFEDGLEVVSGTPAELQKLELTATNTFDLSTLTLNKAVNGKAAGYADGRAYTVDVNCVLPQSGEFTPLITDKAYTVKATEPVTIEGLPVGAQCWAAESDNGGATKVAVDFDSQLKPATVTAEGTAAITVTNTFDARTLKVTKKVVNGPAGPYSFSLACSTEQGPVKLAATDARFKLKAGQNRSISVPLGADCTVKELAVPKAAEVSFTGSDAGDEGQIIVDRNASVTVTNTFPAAANQPGTGGPASGWLLAALLLLGGGGALVLFGRRRHRTE